MNHAKVIIMFTKLVILAIEVVKSVRCLFRRQTGIWMRDSMSLMGFIVSKLTLSGALHADKSLSLGNLSTSLDLTALTKRH